MLYYAIIAEDVANSLERRLAARPDHLARLTRLRDEGRLLLAGPHPALDCEDPGGRGRSLCARRRLCPRDRQAVSQSVALRHPGRLPRRRI